MAIPRKVALSIGKESPVILTDRRGSRVIISLENWRRIQGLVFTDGKPIELTAESPIRIDLHN